MVRSASLLNSKSEFDSFLFAPVGEDKKGMVVSVLTALARLDFDPWQQAADFARLPKEAAKAQLAAMLAGLPGMSLSGPEPGIVAARLVALLPAPSRPAAASRTGWPGIASPAATPSPRSLIPIAIFMVISVAFQLFATSQQAPQLRADGAAPVSEVVGQVQSNQAGPTTQPLSPFR
ncbi:MAG: hypothetical protein ABI216_06045 [Devosia sp.]